MAHEEQSHFIQQLKNNFPDSFNYKKVLEIGSRNVNGSIREMFIDCDYYGIDLDEGPDVDEVTDGTFFDRPNETFDVVCSTECFEHTENWHMIFLNMHRMTKDKGLVFFTCAGRGRGIHGVNKYDGGYNYYRNVEEKDFYQIFNIHQMFYDFNFFFNKGHITGNEDLYFYGFKRKMWSSVV